MKIKSIISILILAVYSIVIAHSFIPHHHHSDFVLLTHECNYNEHDAHHDHQHEITGDCCVNSDQKNDLHSPCSFDEKTILAKSLSLSNLYLPSVEIEFIGLEKKIQSISDAYVPIQTTDPRCRDVDLRGPPQFS